MNVFKKLSPMALVALLIPGLVFQTGCSFSSTVEADAFAAIIIGADALVTALGITGTIPAGDVAGITTIVNAVTVASQDTIDEKKSADTTGEKLTKILGYWNGVLSLVQGLPPAEQALLAVVTQSIKAYINAVAPAGVSIASDGSIVMHTVVMIAAHPKMSFLQRREFAFTLSRQHDKVEHLRNHLAKMLGKFAVVI